MNWEIDIQTVVNVVLWIIAYFWLRPIREKSKRIDELEETIAALNLAPLTKTIGDIDRRVLRLEDNDAHCRQRVLPSLVGRTEMGELFKRISEVERKLESLDERSKNTNGWLEKVDTRLEDVTRGLACLSGRVESHG
jgi:hypothetical protein